MKAFSRDDIDHLTVPERLALMGDLWDSLEDAATPLSSAQADELGRRLASFDDDLKAAVTWEQLKSELVSRAL